MLCCSPALPAPRRAGVELPRAAQTAAEQAAQPTAAQATADDTSIAVSSAYNRTLCMTPLHAQ